MRRLSIAESLREGIAEEMRRDPDVFCLGEDIAVPGGWGGAFTVTLGLEDEFPDRMLNTPIAELGFFGAAVAVLVFQLLTIQEAYEAVEWPVLILFGALIPVSEASQVSKRQK